MHPDSLPEEVESVDTNDFIHGFLMFESMVGFQKEGEMSDDCKRLCNSYIWRMNMMSHYNDCRIEEKFMYINFQMHIHLRKQ